MIAVAGGAVEQAALLGDDAEQRELVTGRLWPSVEGDAGVDDLGAGGAGGVDDSAWRRR